jgi:hypothetical protein
MAAHGLDPLVDGLQMARVKGGVRRRESSIQLGRSESIELDLGKRARLRHTLLVSLKLNEHRTQIGAAARRLRGDKVRSGEEDEQSEADVKPEVCAQAAPH